MTKPDLIHCRTMPDDGADVDFHYGSTTPQGLHTIEAEWREPGAHLEGSGQQIASAVVEMLIRWKGWPHLSPSPVPRGGWTYFFETVEPSGYLLTIAFEDVLDQLRFISWWDALELLDEADTSIAYTGNDAQADESVAAARLCLP
jgi:hypothetical protein